ncbi:MAG TPA: SAM-dependent chlorinase/fluorinase [Solirubrobacteraceae bacterium]|jgi:S-adenosylmethionine hydrolase|nr:SAM-dependent chlorinase/fluorinase [Solirubrobacteraceae bacterium]
MAPASALPALISFLSDYGLRDEFVGVCHGVMVRRCPNVRIIDLTHEIPRHDVLAGATVLRAALAYMPARIHLAVVDPGVGTSLRRAVALRTAGPDRLFVGPDNGLLTAAAQSLGGVVEAVDIGDSPERLQPLSRTFHGRDIFAPVAAALAAGEPLADVGEPIAAAGLQQLELPRARVEERTLAAHVLSCDVFGNVILDASARQLQSLPARPGELLEIRYAGCTHTARYAFAFADVAVGELLVYEDSRGNVALAINRGSAAELLGAARADELLVRRG